MAEFYSSPWVERIVPGRKLSTDVVTPPAKRKILREFEQSSLGYAWASPSEVMRKRVNDNEVVVPPGPIDREMDDYLNAEFGATSPISLDYGLVSPNKKKVWSSPPQRIGRAQNREWSSPHRIIDHPNPENSPGSWVSVRESHFTVQRPHSPVSDIGVRNAFNLHDYVEPSIRPASQATFTIPDKVPSPQQILREEIKTIRKSTVLAEYQPRVSPQKTEVPCGNEQECNLLPSNDKVKCFVRKDGHVVKVSTLKDFDVASLKAQDKKEDSIINLESANSKPLAKNASSPPKKKTVKRSLIIEDVDKKLGRNLSQKSPKVSAKAKVDDLEKKKSLENVNENNIQKNDPKNVAAEPDVENENKENDLEKINIDAKKMMEDLENFLKDDKVVEEKIQPIPSGDEKLDKKPGSNIENLGNITGRSAKGKQAKRKQPQPKNVEEERIVPIEKRKRPGNAKAVQEYIKQQKQKRVDQLKTEREKKSAEMEARKKKLEELRIKSLQLAAASKRKKSHTTRISTIKVIETDEELTMSLGLKQLKPKISYNESISNLKKKPAPQNSEPEPQPELEKQEEKKEEEKVKSIQPEKIEIEKDEEVVAKPIEQTPEVLKAPDINLKEDLNITLKKLAESLKNKMDKQIKSRATSIASKSTKDPLSQKPSQESLRPIEDSNREVVAIDVDAIQTLKEEFKLISKNFQTLHEIILGNPPTIPEKLLKLEPPVYDEKKNSGWLKSVIPHPHPYNVITAVKNKWQLNGRTASTPTGPAEKISITSRESSIYGEPVKYDDDFEPSSKQGDTTTEENYYSMKDNSGSDFSSSILDSDKESANLKLNKKPVLKSPETIKTENSIKESIKSSDVSSVSKKSILSSYKENLVLVPPDLKLVTSKLNNSNSSKNSNDIGYKPMLIEDLNNKVNKESKSESTIAEIIDNLTESDRSQKIVKRTNEQPRSTGSFFNPEAFHLQFQAELTLLETFQQSLSHFLEMERMKTISEVNRVVNEKAINTEKIIEKGDIAVQTSFIDNHNSSEKSIKTVINSESESIKTEIQTEAVSSSVQEEIEISPKGKKSSEKIELSDSNNGISFQMLERMMKDEELRSEHQLALIRLREKTLNEKVKAELTFLEMKKKALKEIGSDEEQNISAIKKKQRGILLKYQSEKEEIERLKKMHKIASEERKIMIKQQKQIQKMQVSTKDMLIKLKKREKSPQKRMPVKAKSLKSYDSQSDISEDIPESIITETVSSVEESIRQSIDSDFEISSKQISEAEDEILKRNTKTIEEKISKGVDKLNKCKKALGEHEKKLLQRRHSVEELLKWKRRLEEEENRLKELEKQAMNVASNTKHRLTKSLRDVKISMRDTSTSPFNFQEASISESSHSITEAIEAKKFSSTSETIESKIEEVATNEKTEESVPEKFQSSASEDIPEEFSKQSLNNSNSRTIEYNSESFESPSSSETPKSHPALTRSKSFEHRSSTKGVTIKQALSPRIQNSRRRYSSGSDDSINLSYTETASEQSDVESRIAALHEQLRRRKLEAERLRREQKKAHRERLKAKEQSLIKQIQAYDSYIQKKKQELEQEYEYSSQKIVKPLIKQPKVAEKAGIKRQDSNFDGEVRLGLHPNVTLRKKEPEVLVPFEKLSAPDKESDNEISERIKEASSETTNSITEQIESKIEEEEIESVIETESRETSETAKSSSISESIPKPEVVSDNSQSESEEQSVSNVSVKTTLHSPEKPEAEKSDTIEKSVEEEYEISLKDQISEEKQESHEEKEAYSTDSFESDFDNEKSKSESVQESTEPASETKISEEIEEDEVSAEIEVAVESKKPREEVVDAITDSILGDLLSESVKLYDEKKKKREEKLKVKNEKIDQLTDSLVNEIISDAIGDMMKIYNRKVLKVTEQPISPDKITSEVRRRIHEIMSLTPTGGMREQGRPQDLMKTTYDVSPISTTPTGETKGFEHEEFLSSISSMVINKTEEPDRRKFEKEIHVDITSNDLTTQHSDVDAFGQEWFDDDFGLSRTRKEAEELRLQQLQIEQEIQQLQAQQQQEQVPYYYLREIPNKPPPPYTPPGKAPAEKPSTEAEITTTMTQAVRILTNELNNGKELSTVEPHPEFFGADDSDSVKCYKVFLFDLAKHIISEVLYSEKDEEVLPWMRTNERLSKYKCKRIDRTFESLNEYVIKKVLILFGFRQKVGKESLIVKWSRKKRDHVDELLVSESQEEESQWTRYDKDQVTVKNEITTAILDSLIDDTVQVLVNIFNKKRNKKKSSV